uniref:Uncharacterized protein n=1 Tax=Florenciella parvula TaxID=236787 RepID=A0A7S2FGX0_9STRA
MRRKSTVESGRRKSVSVSEIGLGLGSSPEQRARRNSLNKYEPDESDQENVAGDEAAPLVVAHKERINKLDRGDVSKEAFERPKGPRNRRKSRRHSSVTADFESLAQLGVPKASSFGDTPNRQPPLPMLNEGQ